MKKIIEDAKEITFVNRPIQVPYNYRIVYKVCKIVLIIGTTCKRGGCSTLKLHIISNAVSSNEALKELRKFLENTSNRVSIIRFDPALTRAINYALAENIITIQVNGKIKLTDIGKNVYDEIMENKDIMIMEKDTLNNISDKLTEDKIDEIIVNWRNSNALDKEIKDNNKNCRG